MRQIARNQKKMFAGKISKMRQIALEQRFE
jgi:hypothetical protein